MKISSNCLCIASLLFSAVPVVANATTITSSNAASLNWFWFNDNTNAPVANTISPAQTPPGSQTGSIDMTTSDVTDRPFVFTTDFQGDPLADLTTLMYESLSVSGSSSGQLLEPTLQIGIGLTSTDTSFEGRLVWIPNDIGEFPAGGGSWDTWDALTSAGGWVFSRNTLDTNGSRAGLNDVCVLGNPANTTSQCSLASILSRIPNLSVNDAPGLGVLGFRTGGSGVVESSFADMLTVGVSGTNTTFDFATTPEPATWVMLLSISLFAIVGRRRWARR